MKNFSALFLSTLLISACATKPAEKPAELPASAAEPAPAPAPDSISGKVESDDEVQGVPPKVEVRLLFRHNEIAKQKADEHGNFKFDGPLEKGQYELAVRVGALHGTRAFTYNGGELKNISVVIAKSEPHRRRRHRRH